MDRTFVGTEEFGRAPLIGVIVGVGRCISVTRGLVCREVCPRKRGRKKKEVLLEDENDLPLAYMSRILTHLLRTSHNPGVQSAQVCFERVMAHAGSTEMSDLWANLTKNAYCVLWRSSDWKVVFASANFVAEVGPSGNFGLSEEDREFHFLAVRDGSIHAYRRNVVLYTDADDYFDVQLTVGIVRNTENYEVLSIAHMTRV